MPFPQPESNGGRTPRICKEIQADLLDYLDGTLPGVRMQTVQIHLDGCASCRLEFQQLRRAETALSLAVRQAPPAGDLLAGFHAKLAASERALPSSSRKGRWGVAGPLWKDWRVLAPTFAVGLLAVLLIRPGVPPVTPSTHGDAKTTERQVASVERGVSSAASSASGSVRASKEVAGAAKEIARAVKEAHTASALPTYASAALPTEEKSDALATAQGIRRLNRSTVQLQRSGQTILTAEDLRRVAAIESLPRLRTDLASVDRWSFGYGESREREAGARAFHYRAGSGPSFDALDQKKEKPALLAENGREFIVGAGVAMNGAAPRADLMAKIALSDKTALFALRDAPERAYFRENFGTGSLPGLSAGRNEPLAANTLATSDADAEEEAYVEVVDDVRQFRSKTRVAQQEETGSDGSVVSTIQIEETPAEEMTSPETR